MFCRGVIFVMPLDVGTEQLCRRALLAAALGQRGAQGQRLADVTLLVGRLRLRQLAVEFSVLRLLLTLVRSGAAEAGRATQILRACGVVTLAQGHVAHPGQRIGIFRVGLQHLLKLAAGGIGIAAVQRHIAFALCRSADALAIVILHGGIVRMTLEVRLVIRFVARLRPEPQQGLTQRFIRILTAAGQILQDVHPLATGAFLIGQHFAQRNFDVVILRILHPQLTQLAYRLRIEGFIPRHGQIVFRSQARWRLTAGEQGLPGGQRGGNVAAARLLTGQLQLPTRHLLHLFGVIQRLQIRILRRDRL
ncbi:hypothetical protein D3C76_1005720 [compost metagenome]